MSDFFKQTFDRIESLREAGIEPSRVVVPAKVWDEFKEQADVKSGQGFMGGDETSINGVKAVWNKPQSSVRIVHEVETDE